MEAKVITVKIVLQDGIKDCGICCLLSIIRFYGGEVPKEYLRELTNTTKEGVSLYNLQEASKKIGFDAEGLSGKLEDIRVDNLPCIAHIHIKNNRKHFIVIYKIDYDKKQVIIMDPAKGKRILSFSEYHLLSSNYYLFLKPKKKIPILKKKNIVYHNIIKLLINHKKIFIFIFLLTTNYFILNIITSFHFKYLIEYAIEYNVSNNLLTICIIMATIYLLKNGMNCLRGILLNKWSSLFTVEIMTFTYKQILLLPYLYFKNRTNGEIISRFQDLGTIRDYITNFFSTITTDVLSCILFSWIMWTYSRILSIIIISCMAISACYTLILSKCKRKRMKRMKASEDVLNSYIIQGISNVDTIKGSHLEKRLIDKFEINYKALQEYVYDYIKTLEIEKWLKANIKDIMMLLLYGFGSYYVIANQLTLSTLIIYQTFVNYYVSSFTNILYLLSNYHSYRLTLDRVEELFMLEKEDFNHSYFYLPYTLEGDIEIKDLNYKIGTRVIFNHLDLIIKQGEKILLSGESGCGKSTLIKMILRYIDTNYGSIQIAGIDINHYHLQNIRSHITYITSNEYLFQDTLKNNICLYQEYEEEEINKVCELCFVNELMKSKNISLETMIEENGFDLSNGERQRIILARSLLRKSSIYIMDEALGQIDIQREKKILQNIFSYLEDKTVIVISHRFNNKKEFDRVVKLEKGKIIENKAL